MARSKNAEYVANSIRKKKMSLDVAVETINKLNNGTLPMTYVLPGPLSEEAALRAAANLALHPLSPAEGGTVAVAAIKLILDHAFRMREEAREIERDSRDIRKGAILTHADFGTEPDDEDKPDE